MRTMPTDHHAVDEIEMMITPTPIRLQVMPKARTWNGFYKLVEFCTKHSASTDTYLTGIIHFFGEGGRTTEYQEPIHMIV